MESILNQTYDNFEIVILDDHSTDNSVEIIDKYRYNRKVSEVIINEKNSGGPFFQWEKGINAAKGEIIWIAESDDMCSPSFLEELVHVFTESNATITFCRSILIDEDGKKLRENNQMHAIDSDFSMDGKEFISRYLGFSNVILNASSVIFDRQAALSVEKDYMRFKGAGDWLFWLEMSERGTVGFVNKELNYYRLHDNTTRSVVKNGVEFREMKKIYEWLLGKHYLTPKQFSDCRKNNIFFIETLDEVPFDIKTELYNMWDVPLLYRIYVIMRTKLRSCIKAILQ